MIASLRLGHLLGFRWAELIGRDSVVHPLGEAHLWAVIDMQDGPQGPVAESPNLDFLREPLARLERRSYKTYKARMVAHQRLHARNNAWNFALVATATATTIASIGLLSDPSMYGDKGDTLLAALAVVSLVASVVVSSMNYGVRSRSMEANYKRIQQISLEAESFFVNAEGATPAVFSSLQREYAVAIESSENHSEGDFAKAFPENGSQSALRRDFAITMAPYLTLLIPLVILVPFAGWLICGG